VVGPAAPLVHLGFGKYARADRIYALSPIEGDARGPGRRTRVWVEGIAEPVVASRSEAAILADMGPGRAVVPGDLAAEAIALLSEIAEQVRGVGPLLRREIRAEAALDLDDLESRTRVLLERTAGASDPEALF
jgi:hypothetical protein